MQTSKLRNRNSLLSILLTLAMVMSMLPALAIPISAAPVAEITLTPPSGTPYAVPALDFEYDETDSSFDVKVENSGDVQLDDLNVVISGDLDCFEWAVATVTSLSAEDYPAATITSLAEGEEAIITVTLIPDLEAGEYNATITFDNDDITPESVELVFTVNPTYSVVLTASDNLVTVTEGQFVAADVTVGIEIKNTGNVETGVLNVEIDEVSGSFDWDLASTPIATISSLAVGSSTTINVELTSVAAGDYEAIITVSNADVPATPAKLDFIVQAENYSIELDPSGTYTEPAVEHDYAADVPVVVNVKNNGNMETGILDVEITVNEVDCFEFESDVTPPLGLADLITTATITSLMPDDDEDITVTLLANLDPGDYTATIKVGNVDVPEETVELKFKVNPAPTPTPTPTPNQGGGAAAPTEISGGFMDSNSVYYHGYESVLVYFVNKDIDLFSAVRVNGNTLVQGTDYDVEGSTVVTLFSDYLESLPAGTYTLAVAFKDNTISTITFTISDEEPPLFEGWFIDVSESDWFYEDVQFVYDLGLMVGTSETELVFSPNANLTRGMIVTILYRREGEPNVAGISDPFDDVVEGAWYENAVIWAAANGIVSGYGGGKFGPGDNVTRQDLTVILTNYAAYAGLVLPGIREYEGFEDEASIADYAKDAVQACFEAGIINGKAAGVFDPRGLATRAEAAAMFHRFIESAEVGEAVEETETDEETEPEEEVESEEEAEPGEGDELPEEEPEV